MSVGSSLPNPPSGRWDAILVGAGHNGLTCAAYLAKAGLSALVLEARERLGGACGIREPWRGVKVSPCAYLLGLLHPKVIAELELERRGLRWVPADAGLFVPFEDGASLQLWEDEPRCEAEIRRVAPRDLAGWRAFNDVKRRLRDALRPPGDRDLWLEPEPTRDEIERRLGRDSQARKLLFEWSMVDYLDHFLESEHLKRAYMGQGVIGTNASPFDAGTASIHFHHQSGRLGGRPGSWGYVEGGIGRVSRLIAEAATEAGAVIRLDRPVARIEPGRGVELAGGERIEARAVVSNADPQATARLLGDAIEPDWQRRVEAIPILGATLKGNLLLRELPDFSARPGANQPHHQGQINTPLARDDWRRCFETARGGRLPDRLWTELYIQTAIDPSVAPAGRHALSVFAQYVPYAFAEGDWDTRRPAAERLVIETLARFAPNLKGAIEALEIFGPPDIERHVGLTGGHIFQGECLPPWMWDKRLSCRTPMPGVYLCGAGTHPGGSVIGVNGRNAAVCLLEDLEG